MKAHRGWHRWLGAAFVLVPLTSCDLTADPEPATTPSGPKCSAKDAACILSNLRVVDETGHRLTLVPIAANAIQASQLSPGKGLPTVTLPSKGTLTFRYGSNSAGIGVKFAFTDPNAARIGGCFNVRLGSTPPGPFGGFPTVAFASVPDGKTTGEFTLTLMPGFDPEAEAADYQLDLYPISAADPSKEAVEQALSGGAVAIGNPISLPVHVDSKTSAAPSTGGASTCSSDSACSAFGGRNCDPKNGARCGGDGLCHCCLALCSSSTGACSCTACDGNCSGDRMCVGSTCVFKVGASPAQ